MANMSKEEYKMLKRLEDDWRWIGTDDNRAFFVDDDLFQFTQWEDGAPYSIVDLIPEYEWAQLIKEHAPVKGEQEKVKIPQFVFDWIEVCKEVNVLDEIFYLENSTTSQNMRKEIKLYFWLRENFDTFAKAWLAYPNIEVEEELLYRARLKVITDEFIASYLRTQSSGTEDRLKALEIGSKYIHEDYRHLSEFTEDELKRLNVWDSNQWEIEEVEGNGED